MSAPEAPRAGEFAHIGREEMITALFSNLIIQQTNMAMMLLGRMPHPETAETIKDLESARIFIDIVEMLEIKTRGNRSPGEDELLRHSLESVRAAYREETGGP